MTVLSIVQCSIVLFEYSAFQISGIYYFQKEFDVSDPKMMYSLSMGFIFISGVISVIACGQYMDRTGDLRSIFIFTMALNALGNLMYTWTISPYYPLIGRLLCGVNMGVATAVTGKVVVSICFLDTYKSRIGTFFIFFQEIVLLTFPFNQNSSEARFFFRIPFR